MNHTQREFDLIVLGATGFTGRLVVEYLLSQYDAGNSLNWAIAGRNAARLESLKVELGEAADDLPVFTADSKDPESLRTLVSRTRVVITTVGPYALYGSELVAACVESGTHYCDLTGEVQWIRKMIDRHEAAAKQSGARILHACGFDSIPFDIGVYFLQSEAARKFGQPCESVKLALRAWRGSASGGTMASMLNAIREGRADRDVARIFADPYSLCPEDARDGPDKPDQTKPLFDADLDAWTAPFVMASVNTRIVRRSNALTNYAYGRDFRYRETLYTGPGVSGYMKALQVTASLGGIMLAASVDMLSSAMQKFFLPKPGEGPSPQAQKKGFYKLQLFGKLHDGQSIEATITGDRDPGYGSTSKIIGECGVCLALDELDVGGGFWTPASAMGDELLKRLQKNSGVNFTIT